MRKCSAGSVLIVGTGVRVVTGMCGWVMMDAHHTVDRSLSHLYPCHPDGVTDVGRGNEG
jgi:hypothetical protein